MVWTGIPVSHDIKTGSTSAVASGSFTAAAGDDIIVFAGSSRSTGGIPPTALSISSSPSLTWLPFANDTYDPGVANRTRVQGWRAVSTGVATTVTLTPTGNLPNAFVFSVISISGNSTDFSNYGFAGAPFGTSVVVSLASAPAAGSTVAGFVFSRNGVNFTAPSGHTQLNYVNPGGPSGQTCYDAGSASQSGTWTTDNGTNLIGLLVEIKPGVTYENLSGSASMSFAGSASIGRQRSVAAAASIAFDATGALSRRRGLSGSAAMAFTATATIGLDNDNLSGSAAMSFAATGELAVIRGLSGSAAAEFDATAAAGRLRSLSGSAAMSFSASGLLTKSIDFSGSAAMEFEATGAVGRIRSLSGSASFSFSATGIIDDLRTLPLYNPFTGTIVLVELTPLDPNSGSRVTLRASSAQDRQVTALNNVKWWPAIIDTPVLSANLFDGDFSTPVDVGSAVMTIALEEIARLDSDSRRYLWASAGVKIYAGHSGDAWPWTQWFEGKVTRFEGKDGKLRFTAEVDTDPFDADVLTETYAGTGGVEGDANLKNRVKPWVFGRAKSVEPVLIDATNNVFQFSAYGPIQAVNALYERASDFGASIGNYASYAALVAADIPNGRWGTCLAEGLVRLGAPPYGVITGDVDGDKPSTWLRKTGEIIERIALNAGVSSSLIDTASLDALDVAVPYNINLVLDEQTKVRDLVQRLARPCNAQAGISWLGKLFVTRPQIDTAVLTLHAQGRRLPPVYETAELDVQAPYWRLEMGAERCWRVHSLDEIAFIAELVDRGPYSATETYREGNIVQDQGSSWVYINPVPTSGNAPPTLPTTSDAFWRVLAQAAVPLLVEWSADASSWHSTFQVTDLYMRTSDDYGVSWSDPVRVVGEDGVPGSDGNVKQHVFKRAATQPSTPTGNGIPSTWSDGPPSGTDPLWMSVALQTSTGTLIGSWSAPIRLDGSGGLSAIASPAALTVACDSAGNAKAGEFNKTSQVTVRLGTSDVTASCSFSGTFTGCSGSVNSAGLVTFTAISADKGEASITATYAGVPQVIKIPISKVRDGSDGSGGAAGQGFSISSDSGFVYLPINVTAGTFNCTGEVVVSNAAGISTSGNLAVVKADGTTTVALDSSSTAAAGATVQESFTASTFSTGVAAGVVEQWKLRVQCANAGGGAAGTVDYSGTFWIT